MMTPARHSKPIIHLLSVASSCRTTVRDLGCGDAQGLIDLVQEAVGDGYRVTGSAAQIEAIEDDGRGGRQDDAARARRIERTLADDRIVAAVALRGGAWLTRILPRIDFDVLKRRGRPLALFGFSELTPLLNIAAGYDTVYAYHDLCPGYLLEALTDHARRNHKRLRRTAAPGATGGPGTTGGLPASVSPTPSHCRAAVEAFAKRWAKRLFPEEFTAFFRDVTAIIEGRGSGRKITGRRIEAPRRMNPTARAGRRMNPAARAGAVQDGADHAVTVVGGNLTTLVTLLSSTYARALHPDGRWLLMEDIHETPDRVDRLLSHLSLSGWLGRYEGILLGQFRDGRGDRTRAVLACLEKHLGRTRPPIVVTRNIGHVWPVSPLILGRPFAWQDARDRRGGVKVTARIPWADLRIV